MSPDRLVYMANQIGTYFASQGPDQAVAGTLEHLKLFWDPRMRAAIIAHLDAEDVNAAHTLAKNGFADTGEPPYPGVARWALSAAA